MLAISEAQLDTFSRRFVTDFISRTARNLMDRFPREVGAQEMNQAHLEGLVRKAIRRAAKYDIVSEHDVQRFAECMVLYGRNFDRELHSAWAREILTRPDTDGTTKMDRIRDYELFVLRR